MPDILLNGYRLEVILLVSSILLITSIISSRVSSVFGVPALLVFLGVGMLAGSDGAGGLAFENYNLAFAIGSVCLAMILFDGGMRTSWKVVKPVLPLASSLSFIGTIVTGAATGIFSHYAFNLSWTEGLLLGAIISSTDAAAVFSILRAKNLSLKGSLKQTLEFEAGSNDPVAIFLTVGVLMFATNQVTGPLDIAILFVQQAGLGLLLGWTGGLAIKWVTNHVGVEYEGLYGILIVGLALCLFALTSSLGGSGFLAVYVAGLYAGNAELIHKGSIVRFLDGMAWLSQILVFLTLGLLVFPKNLITVWQDGLLLAFFMMLIARPLSVFIAAPGKMISKNERTFISWVGLRGAAPIILATLPWSAGLPKAEYFFNLIFFVVLLSVIVQGLTIPWVAQKTKLTEEITQKAAAELSAGLLPSGFVTVEIDVHSNAPADGKRISEIELPTGVLLTSLERDQNYLIPQGETQVCANDTLWALSHPGNIKRLTEIFGEAEPVS